MIDVEELEDPLIALGLAQSHDEVVKLVNAVDFDQSGHIEFKEFLSIMSSVKNDEESEKSPIFVFFKSENCFHLFFFLGGGGGKKNFLFFFIEEIFKKMNKTY